MAGHPKSISIAEITGVPAPAALPFPPETGSDRYEKRELLGEGTYGVVWKARDRVKDCFVALKKVRMEAWEEGIPATALREISVLKEIRHPNIVTLEDVFVSLSGNLYLVFELCDYDLKVLLDEHKDGLLPKQVKWCMYQLLQSLVACHHHRVGHRDVKPQNVLLNADGTLKLADFGLARTIAIPLRAYTHEVITLWYRCPEVLLGLEKYSYAVDIWSAGCIFGEMITGRPMFPGDQEIAMILKITEILGTPTAEDSPLLTTLKDFNPDFPKFRPKPWQRILPKLFDEHQYEPAEREAALDLIKSMLALDPHKRISAEEALKHPYFASLYASEAATSVVVGGGGAAGGSGASATPGGDTAMHGSSSAGYSGAMYGSGSS